MGDGKVWGRDVNGITRRNGITEAEREMVIDYYLANANNTIKAMYEAIDLPNGRIDTILNDYFKSKQP
jgi:hypothetical protein